jgi:hypothetical protein
LAPRSGCEKRQRKALELARRSLVASSFQQARRVSLGLKRLKAAEAAFQTAQEDAKSMSSDLASRGC